MDAYEITVQELNQRNRGSYRLIDIRDPLAFSYGHLPGAENISPEGLKEQYAIPKDRQEARKAPEEIIIYCKKGETGREAVQWLREQGLEAYNLRGGYLAWLVDTMGQEATGEDNFYLDVEQSIRKKFHKRIWRKFTKAIRDYQLVQEGDRIAVCISGGKDSMLMAKLFQELQRHNKFPFELVFLVMDPGYSPENRKIIEGNARRLHVPVQIFETEIFNAVYTIDKNPCYLCARMRRGHLYNKAKELGCNKIALGHHYDDVIETILMGMLYGAQVQTMMPKLHSIHFEGMELIRPLYLVREEDVKAWRDYNNLHFIQCACRFTDTCSTCSGDNVSKRMEVKEMIRAMKKTNPFVEGNIFKSVENVNLDTVIGYKQGGVRHSFLEFYDPSEECGHPCREDET